MKRVWTWVIVAVVTFVTGLQGLLAREPLTFEQRVKAQEAIERVYYQHRIWPKENKTAKPPFEQMVPRAGIESKVADDLKKSAALEQFWQRPLTAAQLQAEINRMARQTKDPGTLKEIFAALGNDPYVIAECLARANLAEQLLREWYADDAPLHGEAKATLEEWLRTADICVDELVEAAGDVYGLPAISPSPEQGGSWSAIAASGLTHRAEHTAVWTGAEMIVWGGFDGTHFLNTGGRYDPAMNSWSSTSMGASCPSGRSRHTAVWTGAKMIVWGGFDGNSYLNDGGLYDPLDTWTATSTGTNCPTPRGWHSAVWAGDQFGMIVWGGQDGVNYLNTGAHYHPGGDQWVPTPAAPDCLTTVPDYCCSPFTCTVQTNEFSQRSQHTAVWTGTAMIVWGGINLQYASRSGIKYYPDSGTWTRTWDGASQAPWDELPVFRTSHTAVWTGSRMVVWGGMAWTGFTTTTHDWFCRLCSGGQYDPEDQGSFGSWWRTASCGDAACPTIPSNPCDWGDPLDGRDNGCYCNIDTVGPSWCTLPSSGDPSPIGRAGHTAVWTGCRMIIWGGSTTFDTAPGSYGAWRTPTDTGGLYDPTNTVSAPHGSWTPTTQLNAPAPRWGHTAVSATWGDHIPTSPCSNGMIVWGGYDGTNYLGDGAIYREECCVVLSPETLPNGTVGTFYNQTISACTWIPGSVYQFVPPQPNPLPQGLGLDSSTGVLSGVPTVTGSITFTATLRQPDGCEGKHTYTITITDGPCNGVNIVLAPATLPDGAVGTPYGPQQFSASGSGCSSPYTYSYSGNFPPGLTLSPTGELSGTPTEEDTYNFTVVATDCNGCDGSQPYTINVGCTLTCTASASATCGVPPLLVNFTSTATPSDGSTPTFDWDFGDSSSHGNTQNTSHTYANIGTYTWTLTVTACGHECTQTGTINVGFCKKVTLSPTSLPNGTVGTAYSQTITASPGSNPFTFSVLSGSLPTGLTLGSDGALSGTPTVAGTSTFTVMAIDACGCTGSHEYTITIAPQACTLTCTATVPTQAAYDQVVSFTATVTQSGTCTGDLTYDWDFGDDSAHAFGQSVTHDYPDNTFGYTWTMTASLPGSASVVCTGSIEILPTLPHVGGERLASSPWRLILDGHDFQQGLSVTIGTDTTPWSDTRVNKKGTKITIGKGKALKEKFPVGVATPIKIVNPDGGSATTSFTRTK